MQSAQPQRRPHPGPRPAAGQATRSGPRHAYRPRPRPISAIGDDDYVRDTGPLGFWDDERPSRWSRLLDTLDARRADAAERLQHVVTGARRDPRTPRRAAVAAIICGVSLFALGSGVPSMAGADVVVKRAVAAGQDGPAPAVMPDLSPPPTAAPAARKTLRRAPTHAATKAPVTHGVISGLAANGIPKVALNAYRVAAARMASAEPACGIPWYLLAGIGREESDHGRFAGATLHADGLSTPRIVGPALDGVHWDYIPAPGNGLALAGDATYAHALGPMQFIPSTWAVYGADATGDGKADIFNINDAALGAARYLCAAGGNLRTHSGQVAAVLAYNHNDQYLGQVLALADAYRRGIAVTGIPVGITSGALPRLADTGYLPPANPAAPTAASRGKGTAAATKSPAKHRTTGTSTNHGSNGGTNGGTGSAGGIGAVTGSGGGTGGSGGSGGSGSGSGSGSGGSGSGGGQSPSPTSSGSSGGSSPAPPSSSSPPPPPTCSALDKLLGRCK